MLPEDQVEMLNGIIAQNLSFIIENKIKLTSLAMSFVAR
jgi:hypothetical protein